MGVLIPIVVGGVLLFMLAKGSGKSGGAEVRPKAGEIWTIGMRTSRPLTEAEWAQIFAQFGSGSVMGVTPGPNANEYFITIVYSQSTILPPVGTVIDNPGDGSTVTMIAAVRAPAAPPQAQQISGYYY